MFFELLFKKITEKMSDSFMPDVIANSISKFIYNLDEGITFLMYYKRDEEIFKKNMLNKKNISILFCQNNQAR